jgi:hypothetical protein
MGAPGFCANHLVIRGLFVKKFMDDSPYNSPSSIRKQFELLTNPPPPVSGKWISANVTSSAAGKFKKVSSHI